MEITDLMLRCFVPFSVECESSVRFGELCAACEARFGSAADPIESERDFFENINILYSERSEASIGRYYRIPEEFLPELAGCGEDMYTVPQVRRC